jgi:hypothetical protein
MMGADGRADNGPRDAFGRGGCRRRTPAGTRRGVGPIGRRRVDYNALHLPRIEAELPTTGRVLFRNSYTEQDARDIGAAMEKVARHYAARAGARRAGDADASPARRG